MSAMVAPDSIASLVAYAWGGMGAAFGPALVLALYWRRFNFWGALASIIAGAAIVSIWQFSSGGPWGIFDMEIAALPGIVAQYPASSSPVSHHRPATRWPSASTESIAGRRIEATADLRNRAVR